MKVVIGTLNSQYIHYSLAPWCLLSGIREYADESIKAVVIEGTVNERIEEAAERILREKPQLLGLSCYIWNITQTLKLIDIVKSELSDVIIAVGGPEVSYRAKDILENYSKIDYVLSGEGEKPFALLCNAVSKGSLCEKIPGVSFRSGEGIMLSQPYISSDEPPSPYTDEYFEAVNGRIAYIETSRGCPFSCAFCLSGKLERVRNFDLEKAKENILRLSQSGSKTIKFVDRTFNANKMRAMNIVSFIIGEYGKKIPPDVCFHFEIAGDLLDGEFLSLLSKAPKGSVQLEIGLQSFNGKTLEAINRKTNLDKLCSNIKALVSKRNIHVHIDLIAGLPYEDKKSFENSFNKAFYLNADMLQFGFLKLLYGAAMREEKEKYPCEFSKDAPYEVISTPYLSAKELIKMHNTENALDRIYNSGRFSNTTKYLLEACKFSPYEFFEDFGEKLKNHEAQTKTLDGFTDFFYEAYKNLCDEKVLRDVMLLDRISTNSSGIIPKSLRVFDNNLKRIKIMLDSCKETRQKKGVKRSIAILYALDKAVYVDYENKDRVTGTYKVNTLDMNIMQEKLEI